MQDIILQDLSDTAKAWSIGEWNIVRNHDGTDINTEILAVHAALLPTKNNVGRVLFFSGSQHDARNKNFDANRLWDPATNRIDVIHYPNPVSTDIPMDIPTEHDLFCCGHAFLEDGSLIAAGGTSKYLYNPVPEGLYPGHVHHYNGLHHTSIFNPASSSWQPAANMNPRRDAHTGGGRWYPTLITLEDGSILAAGGHPYGDDQWHNNNMLEIFNPTSRNWERQTERNDLRPNSSYLPLAEALYYPRLHLLPSGHVLCVAINRIPTNNAVTEVFETMVWDRGAHTWIRISYSPPREYTGFGISSILLPLLPEDKITPYRARVMVAGLSIPYIIDLNETPPDWRSSNRVHSGSPIRGNCNATLLPDRTVLVTGGMSGGDDSTAVNEAELYDPQTGQWFSLARAQVARGYHSVALLLPDGSVWTAGSNKNAEYSWDSQRMGTPLSRHPKTGESLPTDTLANWTQEQLDRYDTRELRMEIYKPPYFFRGRRPEIQSVTVPDIISIDTPDAKDIAYVSLIRCGSVTHAFNSDQRYIGLTIQSRSSTNLRVESPPNNFIAPPGYYLLFIVDGQKVPSLGSFLHIGVPRGSRHSRSEVIMPEKFPKVDPLDDPVKYEPDSIPEDMSAAL